MKRLKKKLIDKIYDKLKIELSRLIADINAIRIENKYFRVYNSGAIYIYNEAIFFNLNKEKLSKYGLSKCSTPALKNIFNSFPECKKIKLGEDNSNLEIVEIE